MLAALRRKRPSRKWSPDPMSGLPFDSLEGKSLVSAFVKTGPFALQAQSNTLVMWTPNGTTLADPDIGGIGAESEADDSFIPGPGRSVFVSMGGISETTVSYSGGSILVSAAHEQGMILQSVAPVGVTNVSVPQRFMLNQQNMVLETQPNTVLGLELTGTPNTTIDVEVSVSASYIRPTDNRFGSDPQLNYGSSIVNVGFVGNNLVVTNNIDAVTELTSVGFLTTGGTADVTFTVEVPANTALDIAYRSVLWSTISPTAPFGNETLSQIGAFTWDVQYTILP